MATGEEAQKAATEFNQYQMGGRALTVNEARPKPEGGFGGGGGFGGNRGGNNAGGRRETMRCILRHLPDESGRGSAGVRLPVLYAEAGDLDTAFAHLDRALDAREPGLVHLAVAPQWDALRPDPRFQKCLARMRLPPVVLGES
jgi:hypothetical protein